jgi:hypothetical protein
MLRLEHPLRSSSGIKEQGLRHMRYRWASTCNYRHPVPIIVNLNGDLATNISSHQKGGWDFIFHPIAVLTNGSTLVGQDAGVVDTNEPDVFIAAAKTRQWDREKSVRMLA